MPLEIEPLLRTRSAIRFDRLQVRRIEQWDKAALLEIIHRRLQAFSYLHEDLGSVCVPALRGHLEDEMVALAGDTPRNLIRLGDYLLQEHAKLLCPTQQEETAWFISKQAWENAKERFEAEKTAQWDASPSRGFSQDRNDIISLITSGENATLEFKSTLSWDIRQGKQSSALKKVIAKTLSGFMNAQGGILLIGVNDQGEVLGLETDFNALRRGSKHKDEDFFRQALVNIVSKHLGSVYHQYIQPQFIETSDGMICAIHVKPSPEPVYLRDGKQREFFVRVGNVTRPLNIVEEAHTYIRQH